ncbi:hypothetical protein HZB01_01935 [Candidatus Woesearchaeota archaeon]|nr:hypothetical protein [Candidatus Woesearchaeota archaeon]
MKKLLAFLAMFLVLMTGAFAIQYVVYSDYPYDYPDEYVDYRDAYTVCHGGASDWRCYDHKGIHDDDQPIATGRTVRTSSTYYTDEDGQRVRYANPRYPAYDSYYDSYYPRHRMPPVGVFNYGTYGAWYPESG